MTAQISDILSYKDKAHSICNEPLFLLLKEQSIKFYSPNTALWRGYVASWKLIDNKLYLVGLKAHLDYDTLVDLNYLYPNQKEVLAEWFSGTIKLNQGKLIDFIHSGYESIYEKSIYLIFEYGILTNKYSKINNSFSLKFRRWLSSKLIPF